MNQDTWIIAISASMIGGIVSGITRTALDVFIKSRRARRAKQRENES